MMSNDFMNQEEIDALLRGENIENDDSAQIDTSDREEEQPEEQEQGLTQQTQNSSQSLTEMERDTLAEIGNISMGSAATALSTLIDRKVTITVPDVSVATFESVQARYPVPCIIVIVDYKAGLQGSNVLVIKERDAAVIGSLMMGEDGTEFPTPIDEIYLSAVTEAMNVMMGSAATSMSGLFNYMIDITPPTTNVRNLAEEQFDLFKSDVAYTVISFRLVIPDLVDSTMLQIVDIDFSKNMVAQLFNREHTGVDDSTVEEVAATALTVAPTKQQPMQEPTSPPTIANTWLDLAGDSGSDSGDEHEQNLGNLNVELIKDIPVQVRAILGRTNMSIENILKLGPGHIMELDSIDGEPIDVYANDTLIARGEVVIVDEQFGIRITEISTPKNRIKSIG